MWEFSFKGQGYFKEFKDTIIGAIIIGQFNVVPRPTQRGTKVYQWYNIISSSLLFLCRRPLCTPPAVLLVDTSAECLSRLSDTSTSVESIVRFGVRSAMLIDKRGRMPGRERSKERGGARSWILRVTRCDTHTISLNLRDIDNETEKDAQTEESPRGVYPGIWKFTSSIIVT